SSAKVEEAAGPDAPREQPKHGLANLSRRCRRVYRFDVSKQLAAMSAVSDLKVGCYPGTLDVLPGLPSRRPAPWPGRRHLALARRRTVFLLSVFPDGIRPTSRVGRIRRPVLTECASLTGGCARRRSPIVHSIPAKLMRPRFAWR